MSILRNLEQKEPEEIITGEGFVFCFFSLIMGGKPCRFEKREEKGG